MRAKAMVVMDGMSPLPGRTLDISLTGLSLTLGNKLPIGQAGHVSFELFLDGKAQIITCRSNVSYCIFSGDDFKIGFQFVNLELSVLTTITKFLR